VVKNVVGSVPSDLLSLLGTGVGFGGDAVKSATDILRQDLESLCLILSTQPYLCGDQPTLADFAVAGLSMYLKFPTALYLDLPAGIGGKGVPGLADVPEYEVFWTWRDRLYADFRKPRTGPTASAPASGPVAIGIE
ncbi:MAG: glutathione S-transferase domain-containing protein, partial [Cyanobacteria bacterium J06623_5]